MKTPCRRFPLAALAVSLVLASPIVGCGARSTMLLEPEDEVIPSSGGAGGHTSFPKGGAGGGTILTGGTGGYDYDTGGAGGEVVASGGSAGTRVSTGGSGGTGGTRTLTGGSPGTGGTRPYVTGGTSGSGGTSSTGGTGGTTVIKCSYPSCLWDLMRDCRAAGACTSDEAGSYLPNYTRTLCCKNGVREYFKASGTSSGMVSGTIAVSKNGQKCYDISFTGDLTMTFGSLVWMDPQGNVVAKGAPASARNSIYITCANGESQTMPSVCPPDASGEAKTTSGTCP